MNIVYDNLGLMMRVTKNETVGVDPRINPSEAPNHRTGQIRRSAPTFKD